MVRYASAGLARYFRSKAGTGAKRLHNRIKNRKSKKQRYAEEYRKAHHVGDNRYNTNKAKDFNFAKEEILPKHGKKKRRLF